MSRILLIVLLLGADDARAADEPGADELSGANEVFWFAVEQAGDWPEQAESE